MATWSKIEKETEGGTVVPMQAPVIVSASRSTDVPAFYADWFFARLRKGYSAWINPFSGARSYVCYDRTRFIVFWSKNPRPLLPYLHVLRERGIGCYVQYTLNDYESERLERVPPLAERIETFRLLVEQLGRGSVVWRFDPMLLTDDMSVGDLLRKVRAIGEQLKGYAEKLVFSYADIATYKKVKRNMEASGIPYHEWDTERMEEFARGLSAMNSELGWGFQLATCGERIDFGRYGIVHNRCIDGDLIVRLACDDKELMDYMNVRIEEVPQSTLFGPPELPEGAILLPRNRFFVSTHRKDPGQRQFCECMASKDIGEYDTCPHLCEYCYANASKRTALENWKRHQENPFAETIAGR